MSVRLMPICTFIEVSKQRLKAHCLIVFIPANLVADKDNPKVAVQLSSLNPNKQYNYTQLTTKSSMKYNCNSIFTIILPSWLTKSTSDNNLRTSWLLKLHYKSTKMLKMCNFEDIPTCTIFESCKGQSI